MIHSLSTVILTLVLALSVQTVQAEPKYDMVIQGPITRTTLAPLNNTLAKSVLEGTTPKEVSIVINSPGGEVTAGGVFITWMKLAQSKGTRFVCYVPGMAASMAFSILMACDERHATTTARLLWHRARVGIMMTMLSGPEAENLGVELLDTDAHIVRELDRTLGSDLSHEKIMQHFEAQTMHSGSSLHKMAPNFIDVQEIIPGAIEALFDQRIPHTAPMEDRVIAKPRQIVYIYEAAVDWITGALRSVVNY